MAEAITARLIIRPRLLAVRLMRVCGGLLTFVIILALVLAFGVYLRLKQGPISLEASLPTMQSLVSEQLPGANIAIGSASFACRTQMNC